MKTNLKKYRDMLKESFKQYVPKNLQKMLKSIVRKNKITARICNLPFDDSGIFARNYKKNAQKLAQKIKNGAKVRVCFSIVAESTFPLAPLFLKMKNDPLFEVFILLIPDSYRGEKNMFSQLEKNLKTLQQKYGKEFVKSSWDETTQSWWDYTPHCDIVCIANPYEAMTLTQYGTEYAAKEGLLTLYTTYSFSMSHYHDILINAERAIPLMWKIFAENKNAYNKYLKTPSKARNIVISGYAKMDALQNVVLRERERAKNIPIYGYSCPAPHH